jgi:hypothetical protein
MKRDAGEFHYRVPWRTSGRFMGHHASRTPGAGFEFRGHTRFLDAPDARRLDLRASLREPHGALMVRIFDQRSAIPLIVVADVSASMGYAGALRRPEVLADFTAACGHSAWRTGDPFGFVACDDAVRLDLYQPPTRMRGIGARAAAALRKLEMGRRGASALPEAVRWLPTRPALVFLVSDYYLPEHLIRRTLAPLTGHAVVPVVLEDRSEWDPGLRFGLVRLRDPESGRARTVLWRPALRRRLQAAFVERRQRLTALFHGLGLRPLWLSGGFDADRVTRYFHG